MLSLWPQSALAPTTTTPRQQSHHPKPNNSLLSLSLWYTASIPEFIRETPNIPASLLGVVKTILNIVNPYPPLPNELIHYIFAIAAFDNRDSCRQLCLVSSWTRLLVLPHLIPSVVVTKDDHWLLTSSPKLVVQDSWVSPLLFTRHLWINSTLNADHIEVDLDFHAIFSIFPNISSLSVSTRDLSRMAHQNVSDLLPRVVDLKVQGCTYEQVFEEYMPFYSQLKKLDFCLPSEQKAEDLNMSWFPHISYVAVMPEDICSEEQTVSLLALLRRIPQLDTIVIRLYSDLDRFGMAQLTLAEIVERASNLDGRFAVTMGSLPFSVFYWQAHLEGRPISDWLPSLRIPSS